MSIYDFSTLYTTMPHNLIKEKLSQVVDSLPIAVLIFCVFVCVGSSFCCVVFVSFLVLQSSRWGRERDRDSCCLTLYVSWRRVAVWCSVSLPHDAMG